MTEIADARVRVRIGETVFHTTKATLIESQLFASLFALPEPGDGEYFVDGDPELFTHILRYLRTKLFPLFYDRAAGHDVTLYAALQQQAEFYQVPQLVTWLSERRYFQAVRKTSKHFSHAFVGRGQMAHMHAYWGRDEELSILSWNTTTRKGHKCPAGKWEHDGNSHGACARERCWNQARGQSMLAQHPVLEVEGILTKIELREGFLRQAAVDSSGVIVAAMQEPPPYAEGSEPLPTTEVPASSSGSNGASPGHGGGGIVGTTGAVAAAASAGAGAGGGGGA